jgi:hypothetical protein
MKSPSTSTCLDLDLALVNPRTTSASQLTEQQPRWITWRITTERSECLEYFPTSLTLSTFRFSKISLRRSANRLENLSLRLDDVQEETVQVPIRRPHPQVTASLRRTRDRTLELEHSAVEAKEKHREVEWEEEGED